MEYIYIGEIVNTHGLKGEVRLLSNFKFKKDVFKKGMTFYIGKEYNKEIVSNYRTHKNYDMVTFENKNYIDDIIIYKGEPVYVKRLDLNYDGYLNEDLIGLEVYCEGKEIGKVVNILSTNAHEILVIENGNKHMIPNLSEFIENVDLEKGTMQVKYMKGLFNEDWHFDFISGDVYRLFK